MYAAILGVLALLLFLSPQIAKLISADVESREILKNNNFNEPLNDRAWTISLNNPKNTVSFANGKFNIVNSLAKENYTLATQRLELAKGKIYLLEIRYTWQNNRTANDRASFGILKYGLQSELALSFPLPNSSGEAETKKYFKINESIKDPYFFLLTQGTGNFEATYLSLKEFDQLPEGAELEIVTSGQHLPIKIQGGEVLPNSKPSMAPSLAPSTGVSATPPALSPSPSATASPAAFSSRTSQGNTNSTITVHPGWSVITLTEDINSDVFASSGIYSFQMFGGKWSKGKKASNTFSKQGAVYLYSPSNNIKEIEIPKEKVTSKLTPSKRWNLLTNLSSEKLDSETQFELFGEKATISKLISEKKASSDIYILNSTPKGVEMKKIDPIKESIPARSAYWLYLLN